MEKNRRCETAPVVESAENSVFFRGWGRAPTYLFLGDDLFQIGNRALHIRRGIEHLGHLVAGIDDRRVIAAEGVADARQAQPGHLARQIDGDVARQRDFLLAGIAAQHVRAQAVIIGHAVDNQLRRDALGVAHDGDVVQRVGDDLLVDFAVVQLGVGVDAGQRAFQLADVLGEPFRDQVEHVRR